MLRAALRQLTCSAFAMFSSDCWYLTYTPTGTGDSREALKRLMSPRTSCSSVEGFEGSAMLVVAAAGAASGAPAGPGALALVSPDPAAAADDLAARAEVLPPRAEALLLRAEPGALPLS